MKISRKNICWFCQILASIILFQTLYFKFSAATESIYIFTKLNLEPFGRIVIGIVELICSVLLLFNKTAWIGALISFGIMLGAIFSHISILGLEILNDNYYLFSLCLVTTISSGIVLYLRRIQIPYFGYLLF